MFRKRTAALLAISVSALSFAAVACGGSGDDEGTDPEDGSPASGASATSSARPGSSASPAGETRSATASSTGSGSGSSTPSPSGGNGGSSNGTPAATPTFEIVTPVATATFVAAEGEYCDTVTPMSPPNTLFGLLEIDGEPVPAGTEVTVAFDGVPGPSRATREAGGYRVDFGTTKDAACANREGASLSIVVNGVQYATGRTAGSAAAIRFDIVE